MKKLKTNSLTPLLALQAFGIILAAGIVYAPVLHGDWLWDDDIYITQNPVLRDLSGLWRIWFAPRDVTYFPLTSTVEWFQWNLWGTDTLGYHLTNVALHVISAFLIWRLLVMLFRPSTLLGTGPSTLLGSGPSTSLRTGDSGGGAAGHERRPWAGVEWFGGLLFVVHPVMVESVAWITELKNTLSLPLLLMAMIAYVRFDAGWSALSPTRLAEDSVEKARWGQRAPPGSYFISVFLFLLAMLAKSTAVMFPAVLLLYAWWKRGRIVRADVLASAPFFLVSLGLGLLTVWFEQNKSIGAGVILLGGIPSRLACAGLAVAFYISKFILPVGLLPIYPRWTVDPPSALQFLPWLVLAVVLAWIWRKRTTWGRHVIFGFGWFLLNLAPMAGLVPIGYMANSWVADHFVYLPAVGLVGLAAAGLGSLRRFPACWVGAGVAIVALACAARSYAHIFLNQEAIWTYTAERNPGSWLAQNNLGSLRVQQGRLAEGLAHFEASIRINPGVSRVHLNLGNILMHQGRTTEAIEHYRQAVLIDGGIGDLHEKLGEAFLQTGRLTEAEQQFSAAVRLDPGRARGHDRLGKVVAMQGRPEEARSELETALRLDPDDVEAHVDFGNVLFLLRQLPQAGEQYEEAIRLSPDYAEAHANLGNVLYLMGRRNEAIDQYRAALQLSPGDARTRAALDSAMRNP